MTICYDNMIEHAVAEYDKLINYHIIFHYIMSHYVYHIVVIIISDLCRYYMTSLLVALLLLINIFFYWIIMFLTARSPFRKKIEYHWIIALQSWIKFGYIGDHLGAGTYRLVRDMEVPHVVATPPWPFDKLQRALIERHPMQETESGLCWNKDWSLIFVWPFHWQFFFVGELEDSLTSRTPRPLLFGGERVIQVIPNFSAFGSGQVLTPQSWKDHILEKKTYTMQESHTRTRSHSKKKTYTQKKSHTTKKSHARKNRISPLQPFFWFHFFLGKNAWNMMRHTNGENGSATWSIKKYTYYRIPGISGTFYLCRWIFWEKNRGKEIGEAVVYVDGVVCVKWMCIHIRTFFAYQTLSAFHGTWNQFQRVFLLSYVVRWIGPSALSR